MASAVLASRNESSWVHMGKTPYSNPHLNSNPKKKQKQFHQAAANGVAGRYHNSNNVDSPAVTQTASDDAYSFNQTSTTRNAVNYGGYLSFNVTSYTKSELVELRKRLAAELDQIRDLRNRIESSESNIVENPRSQAKPKKFAGNKRPVAVVGSVPKKLYDGHENGGLQPASVNFEGSLKECGRILAKLMKHRYGYIFKAPVDAEGMGLHDYRTIVKRPMDLGTVKSNLTKNLYPSPSEFAADVRLTFNNALLYNPKTDPVNGMAEQLLAQFEEMFKPVQEKMNGLLNQQREREFHELKVRNELPFQDVEELQGSSWNNHVLQNIPSPLKSKKSKPKASPVPMAQVLKKADRLPTPMQSHSTASTPSHPLPTMNPLPIMPEPLPPSPVRAASLPTTKEPKGGRGTMKQPKPRAKDPNKRDMSMEEKQKLGAGLQILPQEKMPQLVQIIRKRNEHLAQDGDEIELDIEALDTETLWELDRFVTNWKKMVSKTKRQALMMNNNPASGVAVPSTPTADADMGEMSDKNDDSGRKFKDNDDEDVDIDDDMPAESFPPVEIEKDEGPVGIVVGGGVVGVSSGQDHEEVVGGIDQDQKDGGNASSSSSSSGSSSSDSSSTSDSDSGSSSGSDSDADDAHS